MSLSRKTICEPIINIFWKRLFRCVNSAALSWRVIRTTLAGLYLAFRGLRTVRVTTIRLWQCMIRHRMRSASVLVPWDQTVTMISRQSSVISVKKTGLAVFMSEILSIWDTINSGNRVICLPMEISICSRL